jgi:hypothetical protein
MTVRKFYSELHSDRYLEVMQIEKKFITIYIESDDDEDECTCVDLTIKDAEELMDELHRQIIKAEGGENE